MEERRDLLVIKTADHPDQGERTEQETQVADAIDDERLAGGVIVFGVGVPKADQQVRAQTDAFPAKESHRQAGAQHQQDHREQEQVQVSHETGKAAIRPHIADRIQGDQRADAGDEQQHHARQAIEQEAERQRERPGVEPRPQALGQRRSNGITVWHMGEVPGANTGDGKRQSREQHRNQRGKTT